jgi:hypothetical protein
MKVDESVASSFFELFREGLPPESLRLRTRSFFITLMTFKAQYLIDKID